MSRSVLAIAILCAVGLGVAAARAEKPEAAKPDDKVAEGIDYAKWTLLTPKPVVVELKFLQSCIAIPRPKYSETFGPHLGGVKYFANPEADKTLKDDPKAAMPVGATILKEKLKLVEGKEPKLLAYGAMVKREKGYDAEHGDWEYVYADLSGEKPKIERGKIETCIRCHSIAKDRDYLYRTNLTKPEKK